MEKNKGVITVSRRSFLARFILERAGEKKKILVPGRRRTAPLV